MCCRNNPSPQDASSSLLLELERSGVRGQVGDVCVQTLGWPNTRAAVLTLDSGGGGFVQRHELLRASPRGSGAALE